MLTTADREHPTRAAVVSFGDVLNQLETIPSVTGEKVGCILNKSKGYKAVFGYFLYSIIRNKENYSNKNEIIIMLFLISDDCQYSMATLT